MPVLTTEGERLAHAQAVTLLIRWEWCGLPADQSADAYAYAFALAMGRPTATAAQSRPPLSRADHSEA